MLNVERRYFKMELKHLTLKERWKYSEFLKGSELFKFNNSLFIIEGRTPKGKEYFKGFYLLKEAFDEIERLKKIYPNIKIYIDLEDLK